MTLDLAQIAVVIGAASGLGGGLAYLLTLRQRRQILSSEAELGEARANSVEADGQSRMLTAAASAIGSMLPSMQSQIEEIRAENRQLRVELVEVRAEVVMLMGKSTEDRVELAQWRAWGAGHATCPNPPPIPMRTQPLF